MFPILEPSGLIASQELVLMINVTLLMLIVAVPVFILTFFFAWRYRAQNTKARYEPEWENALLSELVWWAIPIEIVLVLGALTFSSTHALDPHKPLEMPGTPLIVEVVALPSGWLFIYPNEKIATLNTLTIPTHRPITFTITADAPMNSFWIPALAGQIYAMTGMSTALNVRADKEGTFRGQSANYSGEHFAQMVFKVHAVSPGAFDSWIASTQAHNETLSPTEYARIRTAGVLEPVYYGLVTDALYQTILMKFMSPKTVPHVH